MSMLEPPHVVAPFAPNFAASLATVSIARNGAIRQRLLDFRERFVTVLRVDKLKLLEHEVFEDEERKQVAIRSMRKIEERIELLDE